MQKCDVDCYEKYNKVYDDNKNNKLFDFAGLKSDLNNCTNKCENIYKQVIDHQAKGAEISYVKIKLLI